MTSCSLNLPLHVDIWFRGFTSNAQSVNSFSCFAVLTRAAAVGVTDWKCVRVGFNFFIRNKYEVCWKACFCEHVGFGRYLCHTFCCDHRSIIIEWRIGSRKIMSKYCIWQSDNGSVLGDWVAAVRSHRFQSVLVAMKIVSRYLFKLENNLDKRLLVTLVLPALSNVTNP